MAVRKIIIASFGNRNAYISSLVDNIREYSAFPIILYTDRQRAVGGIEQIVLSPDQILWKDSPRWPIRNTNFWLAKAVIERAGTKDVFCCLNDDMRIVHAGWEDGFQLAEKFGICVPQNPRIFVKYNMLGTDTTSEDWKRTEGTPIYAPACNVSPMFAYPNSLYVQVLLSAYINELKKCMRGTLAFWLAMYKVGVCPLFLPEQWCVSASNALHIKKYEKVLQGKKCKIEPIMLHWGQQQVREVFGEQKSDI